jgi:feruloyl esterase
MSNKNDHRKRLAVLLLCGLAFSARAVAASCGSLAALSLPHGKITLAISEPAGPLTGLTPEPIENLPAFCRVAATLTPTSDSNIRIEIWMPAAGWNGKFQGTGNGGYAGSIMYQNLAGPLRLGYVVANTDMGTSTAPGQNADSLVGHPEIWRDWGSRSTHEMTVAAKLIVLAFYGKDPAFSYFVGCSTGGQQALVEAQRFPDDYDGIAAGGPANNRTHLHMDFIWDYAAAEEKPESYIPPAKLPLLSNAVLNACVAQKAVASDKFLSNPTACHWDPQALLCKSADAPDCLTAEQVIAAKKLYDGPRNPETLASVYPGLTRGSEFDWNQLLPQPGAPILDSLFKWTFGVNWNWRTFDFNRDVATVDATLASMVNATDPDLHIFKAHGHKLILYHGWADVIVPSLESINYYRTVEDAQAKVAAIDRRSNLEETQSFFRLFMVPGMAHCAGGPGLNGIDLVKPLELWVEKGIPPDKIVAGRYEKGTTQITRPVCPYPQAARYNGNGDTNDAGNFSCSEPSEETTK